MALPNVSEDKHFGKASWRVNKKMFATYNEKEGLGIGLEPAHVDALVDSDPRVTIYPRAKNVVLIDLSAPKTNWKQIADLIAESYRLLGASSKAKPKKRR